MDELWRYCGWVAKNRAVFERLAGAAECRFERLLDGLGVADEQFDFRQLLRRDCPPALRRRSLRREAAKQQPNLIQRKADLLRELDQPELPRCIRSVAALTSDTARRQK